jgi:hypothetical protein
MGGREWRRRSKRSVGVAARPRAASAGSPEKEGPHLVTATAVSISAQTATRRPEGRPVLIFAGEIPSGLEDGDSFAAAIDFGQLLR